MEQMRLPIVGKIQHGEQQKTNNRTKVVELKYFIAHVRDENLKFLENRFNELYPQQNYITVKFINEEPFRIKKVRYNQSGAVCYCMNGSEKAKQKISNNWNEIDCTEKCKYRKIDEKLNKPTCNREGNLVFMLPEVSSDKVWIMKITGQTSINNLETYFDFQKQIGNSIKGNFVLYLTEETQTSKKTGQKYKNQILNIVKKEDFNFQKQIDSNVKVQKEKSTKNSQSTDKKNNSVNSKVTKTEKDSKKVSKIEESKKNKKTPKSTNQKEKTENTEQEDYNNYYMLIDTHEKMINDKNYVIGTFNDMEDNQINVIIPHELADELSKKALGTWVKMDLQKSKVGIYTNNLEYFNPIQKVAA